MDIRAITRVLARDICFAINENSIEEIRIRVNRAVILRYRDHEDILEHIVTQTEIINILQSLCNNSVYAYQSQICDGYITLQGGHRVGITGNIAMKDGKIVNVNYISSLNFRIAREIIGSGEEAVKQIVEGKEVNNTLIVSKPRVWKTTMLRDVVRSISNMGFTVSLIDERGEIASMYKGIPQNDIGLRTDVLDNITKSLGMKIAVRTMSPQVIVADEIGTMEDLDAINYGICSGVKGIFSAHGDSIQTLRDNQALNKLYEQKLFKKIIFLKERGKISKIYTLDKNMYKNANEILE